MHASSHEVAWVATVLEDLPDVDVLSVRVESASIEVGPDRTYVPAMELDIHADGWGDAIVLAKALHLHEIGGRKTESEYGVSVWRTWAGWATEGSHEVPVRVVITAAEREADIPHLFAAQVEVA